MRHLTYLLLLLPFMGCAQKEAPTMSLIIKNTNDYPFTIAIKRLGIHSTIEPGGTNSFLSNDSLNEHEEISLQFGSKDSTIALLYMKQQPGRMFTNGIFVMEPVYSVAENLLRIDFTPLSEIHLRRVSKAY